MPSQTVEKVVEQIKNLSKDEQIEVRNILNQISLTPEEIERKIQEEMLAEGLVSEIKPPRSAIGKRDFMPIEIEGKPISETIIEERR